MCPVINTWCAIYSIISAIIQALITVVFLELTLVPPLQNLLLLFGLFSGFSEIPSPCVQKQCTKSGTDSASVLSQLAHSRAKCRSHQKPLVCPASALQQFSCTRFFLCCEPHRGKIAEIVSADTTQVHMPLPIRSCVASCTSYCMWKE